MTLFHRILSQNVRTARELRGWSRDHLAEKLGISTNYLSEIETGQKFPRPENLEKLCEAFTLQPWELFQGAEVGPYDRKNKFILAAELKRGFSSWVDSHLRVNQSSSTEEVAEATATPETSS